MNNPPNSNSASYHLFFREEIKRMNTNIEKLLQKQTDLQIEVATLKERSRIWGGTTGGIAGAIIGGIMWMLRSGAN